MVLGHSKGQMLLVKEALHIQMTPSKESFNKDGGVEVPGCWITVLWRLRARMIVSKLHGDMDDSPRVPKISHTPIQLPAH